MSSQHLLTPAAALFALACRLEPKTPLEHAAVRDDAAQIKRLIARGETGAQEALYLACRLGRLAAIDALLEGGARVDQPDNRNGWTPLLHALHKDQTAAALRLLARGADARRGTEGINRGNTPLRMAVGNGNAKAVRVLLARGADPWQRSSGGRTMLALAVGGGAPSDIDRPLFGRCMPDTVRALLEKAPDLPMGAGVYPNVALRIAKMQGCERTLEMVKGKEPRGPGRLLQ